MSKDVSSDPLHGKLLAEYVPESFQLGNQKGSDNSILDNNFKGKWPWRSSIQYNMPRTSSTEFWLPPAETQGDSSDESYDASNQKWMSAIPQQNDVPTLKSLSIKSQGSSQPNCTGAGSSLFHPAPWNVPGEGNFPLQPTSSFPQQPWYAPKRQFNAAPDEFFTPPPGFGAHHITMKDSNNPLNNYRFQNSHLPPGSDGPPFTSSPPSRMPDISKRNISDDPNGLHSNPTFQQNIEPRPNVVFEPSNLGNFCASPNGLHPRHHPSFCPDTSNNRFPHNGLEFPPQLLFRWIMPPLYKGPWGTLGYTHASNHAQGYIGIVLLAMDRLKSDQMLPTFDTIEDCIRYADFKLLRFNVEEVIDIAIKQQLIVTYRVEIYQFYWPRNVGLWKCVDYIFKDVNHPKATWDAVEKYVSSFDGRSAIMSSECRYHAATILKKSCLTHLVLGEIFQILHVIVHNKKWMTTSMVGWQPISITLPEANGEAGVDFFCRKDLKMESIKIVEHNRRTFP